VLIQFRFPTNWILPPEKTMQVHFLGTTGYHPNNRRHTTCVMIPEIGLVFDAGTGFFRVRDLIQTDQLTIALSHIHLDHVIGLTFLFDVLFQRDVKRVNVYMEQAKAKSVRDNLFDPMLFPVIPEYHVIPIEDGTLQINDDISLKSFPLKHPGGSIGFRLDGPNTSLAFITDTVADANAAYVDEIKGVDTLIHECYFADGYENYAELTGHSCLTPVAEVARAADAGCLFLIHINPLLDCENPFDLSSVKNIFSDIFIAEDGMIVEL
jgi:ribonuclease Z